MKSSQVLIMGLIFHCSPDVKVFSKCPEGNIDCIFKAIKTIKGDKVLKGIEVMRFGETDFHLFPQAFWKAPIGFC